MKALILATLLSLAAGPAAAQTACAPRDILVERLLDRYAETAVAIGLTSTGFALEVYTSETGSFTIVQTAPSGVSCIVSDGLHFQLHQAAGKPPGAAH